MFQKTSGMKKLLIGGGGEGGIKIIRRKLFCLTLAKNFVGDPSVQQNFGYRKISCMRGISRFSVKEGGHFL